MNENIFNLQKLVYTEYMSGINQLEKDAKYHLLHHLYLWNGNIEARDHLKEMKHDIVGENKISLSRLQQIYSQSSKLMVKNAPELRQPYLARHPLVRASSTVLLDTLFMLSVFKTDNRDLITEIISNKDMELAYVKLLDDPEAIAHLSTYAVNFIYLYDQFYKKTNSINPSTIISYAEILDVQNPNSLLLYFYFITHCIIADSLFYSRAIPKENIAIYVDRLEELDNILMTNSYANMHLDIKFEVLVCAKMCGIKLRSESRIYEEAAQSLATDGNYIIDKLNDVKQGNFSEFSSSEHRNSLFLMSCTEFKPTVKGGDF